MQFQILNLTDKIIEVAMKAGKTKIAIPAPEEITEDTRRKIMEITAYMLTAM